MTSALAAWLTAAAALAADLPSAPWSIDGFGTIAATYQDTPGLEFRRSVAQAHGATAGRVDTDADSVLGLQAKLALGERFHVATRGILSPAEDGTWRPKVDRAYLAFTPTGTTQIRAGRIGFDAYLLAESPDVGYSYLPIRPAPEFFGLFASDEIDGGDAAFTLPLADGTVRLRLFGGHNPGKQVMQNGTRVDASSHLLGTVLDYQWHSWMVRLGVVRFRADSIPNLQPLAAALNAVGMPDAMALAGEFSRTSHGLDGGQLGLAYDGHPVECVVLLTHINSHVAVGPKLNSGVATLGYHLSSFTPFASYAAISSFGELAPSGIPTQAGLDALAQAVHAAQTGAQATQHTISVGLRYDLSAHIDIKLQLDHISMNETYLVFDRNLPPVDRDHLTVAGVAVDFTF